MSSNRRNDPRAQVGASLAERPAETRSRPESGPGALQQHIGFKDKLVAGFLHHQMVAVETLLQLLAHPASSLMTWLVIAIAVTLPGALWMSVSNVEQLSGSIRESGRITLYLNDTASNEQGRQLAATLERLETIDEVIFISHEQALENFRRTSGMADALDLLPGNPLPVTLVVQPASSLDATSIRSLSERLREYPDVAAAQLDMAWLERLRAWLVLVQRMVWVLGGLLALAILLVVGNTIRLAIAARVDEIRVSKLVGATNAWVRRPFLYTGLWYGLVGGLMAWLMLIVLWLLLKQPAADLASRYGSGFELAALEPAAAMVLLIGSMLLGWAGAWWSVSHHLDEIEP
ncbi:permease-like cell division protein FtsX [Parathalassolituus penaei]|uniref:Cell division protein FtsX n=1 Tax=Parathalassolituus penaei TaxID=2997323 RepID=A0A9X3IT90_9GAMM|nr:permease-like cell division protein FtsX [Parathalassolituus penaei]MCY0965664.1 permease-like cell division protein FtsX [Parathalassolituus penaei]